MVIVESIVKRQNAKYHSIAPLYLSMPLSIPTFPMIITDTSSDGKMMNPTLGEIAPNLFKPEQMKSFEKTKKFWAEKVSDPNGVNARIEKGFEDEDLLFKQEQHRSRFRQNN